ncbi:hypothetical protein [Nonomuraea turcica]|uniref:hypothetical protein n=1 Tax=Nonomuraea sp. G32 TaxID=3067274 RepID=UPI00273CCE6A|nr:hypothetical protein [Nonomuraea sp. G32]MDP4505327.1 hypothetical protein [Nonomuraea sp. G32]
MLSRPHHKTLGHRSPSQLLSLTAALALGMAAVWGAPGMADPVAAAPGKGSNVDKYLGEWNYDQPDRETMRNIAEIRCPATRPGCESPIPKAPPGTAMQIPQIGRIVFTKEADGKVVGRTDRGCTWRFTAQPDSLQLDPPSQHCVNRVINSGYTITRWSVTVTGRREKETIEGVSHQPNGDYDFVLEHGARTKVGTEPWTKAAKRFTGQWTYVPADPSQLTNIVVYRTPAPDGSVKISRLKQRGLVDMVVKPDRTIAARTSDGCRWTLAARGNTAELDPPGQVCRRPGETVTLDFLQVASDGKQQASIMNGTVRRDDVESRFLLNVGALIRR